MYILDTNVISEIRKAATGKANPKVLAWADSISINQLFLSSITILELETGILLKERNDKKQGRVLRQWLEQQVLTAFCGRVLGFDQQIALQCAKFHIPNPRSYRDSMIAATAYIHNMTVVTRNIEDFSDMGITLINP